jgi:hypothetical protein
MVQMFKSFSKTNHFGTNLAKLHSVKRSFNEFIRFIAEVSWKL